MVIRGMCALRPGVPGCRKTSGCASILGRFLEHSRIFPFCNGGDEQLWIGSADMMHRNLDRRVEALVEVRDPDVEAGLQRGARAGDRPRDFGVGAAAGRLMDTPHHRRRRRAAAGLPAHCCCARPRRGPRSPLRVATVTATSHLEPSARSRRSFASTHRSTCRARSGSAPAQRRSTSRSSSSCGRSTGTPATFAWPARASRCGTGSAKGRARTAGTSSCRSARAGCRTRASGRRDELHATAPATIDPGQLRDLVTPWVRTAVLGPVATLVTQRTTYLLRDSAGNAAGRAHRRPGVRAELRATSPDGSARSRSKTAAAGSRRSRRSATCCGPAARSAASSCPRWYARSVRRQPPTRPAAARTCRPDEPARFGVRDVLRRNVRALVTYDVAVRRDSPTPSIRCG